MTRNACTSWRNCLRHPAFTRWALAFAKDRKHLIRKFGTEGHGLLDLNHEFAKKGYRRELGVRDAIAISYGCRFIKSRKISTLELGQQSAQRRAACLCRPTTPGQR